MRIITLWIVIVIVIAGACAAGLTQREALTWLERMAGAPAMDVSGTWDSGSRFGGGWGEVRFAQTGNQVIGAVGLYSAEGRVIGDRLYLVLLSGGAVYYTAVLETGKDGSLRGMAVERELADAPAARDAGRHPLLLQRQKAPR